MTISKELQDELTAKYNPVGSDLRRLQMHLLILLDKFDDFCKKNDIRYWLSSGTCLGAVRHDGFIPWDDDIDVEMPREDYLKFMRLWKDDEDFVLQTYQKDLYYTEPFPKLRLRNTYVREGGCILSELYDNNGIFFDIFVMERSNALVAKFCHLILGSLRHLSYHFKRICILDAVFFVLKKTCFGAIRCMRILKILSNKDEMRHTLGTGVVKNIRCKKNILPLTTLEFEGRVCPMPGDYDAYLKKMFGNYNNIPKVIHTHTLKDIKFLSDDDYDRLSKGEVGNYRGATIKMESSD